ncbi:MAG TPA: hypothetical protein V6C71_00815 [Coleofasciculaceae cyanobacterium]
MSTNPISSVNTLATNKQIESINSSSKKLQTRAEIPPLLPRSAWNNQLAYFKIILRAKLNLDRAEREAIEAAKKSAVK